MSTHTRPLQFVDLFAGCGGLSLGLEMAGFKPVFANELSPAAMETYLRNRDAKYPLLRRKYHVHNVKDLFHNDEAHLNDLIDGLKLDYGIDVQRGELDLVVGGPPCQGYSVIGHRRSYSVERRHLPSNHLYQDMARIIHRLRPRIFLFENVQGLLSARWTKDGQKGEIWNDVFSALNSIPGYDVRTQVVYAKDYGTPQNRPRVLVVGVRNDLGIVPVDGLRASGFLPEPTGRPPDILEVLSDLVDPDYESGQSTRQYPRDPESEVQQWLRLDPMSCVVRPAGSPVTEHDYTMHTPRIEQKFQYMLDNAGAISSEMHTKKFRVRVLPKQWGDRGPNITATSLPDDYVHFSQPRILTVREWARLQMFPDWYEFSGQRTTGGVRRAGNPQQGFHEREVPKYTQIGNAVPVSMARVVGLHLAKMLTSFR